MVSVKEIAPSVHATSNRGCSAARAGPRVTGPGCGQSRVAPVTRPGPTGVLALLHSPARDKLDSRRMESEVIGHLPIAISSGGIGGNDCIVKTQPVRRFRRFVT